MNVVVQQKQKFDNTKLKMSLVHQNQQILLHNLQTLLVHITKNFTPQNYERC